MTEDYMKFLDENLKIPSAQDRNPMFYVLTAARLGADDNEEKITGDAKLVDVLKRVEILCKDIGQEAVESIVSEFKPVSVILELSDCKTRKERKDAIVRIYGWFKQNVIASLKKFSDYYRIDLAFRNFLASKELETFLGSL